MIQKQGCFYFILKKEQGFAPAYITSREHPPERRKSERVRNLRLFDGGDFFQVEHRGVEEEKRREGHEPSRRVRRGHALQVPKNNPTQGNIFW
jgi:hypothetical protein